MSPSQTHDLHRSLLRPTILHTLRAAGFHATRPSVLDTLTNLAERYLSLLATSTATYYHNNHTDIASPGPSITDVRMALQECGALDPLSGSGDAWREIMRVPISREGVGEGEGMEKRAAAEKLRREDEDVGDVKAFKRWVEGPGFAEIRRVAAEGGVGTAGVGAAGGANRPEDFVAGLMRRKVGGEEAYWSGSVLGRRRREEDGIDDEEDKRVVLEGGPVARIADWKPTPRPRTPPAVAAVVAAADAPVGEMESATEKGDEEEGSSNSSSLTLMGDEDGET